MYVRVHHTENVQVATEYSGTGDPARSMALLWGGDRTRPTRGPQARPDASTGSWPPRSTLADAEGLAALSMRRVAERLGVGAMSLYTYVPGKAELLDLMLDTVGEPTTAGRTRPGGWRAALELRARRTGRSTTATRGCSRSPPAGRCSAPT